MKRKFFAAFLSLCMVMSLVPMTALAAEDTAGTDDKITITGKEGSYDTISAAATAAEDGDTIVIPAGTYMLENSLDLSKRVNLKGDGAGNTTIVGAVSYTLAATTGSENAAISVSDITFQSGDSNVQGLQFKGAQGTEQKVAVSVSNCVFDGWMYGITVNSHANGVKLTVSDTDFSTTWCGVSINVSAQNEGYAANNTLTFGSGIIVSPNGCAAQKFNNLTSNHEGYKDNYYKEPTDYANDDSMESNPSVSAVGTYEALVAAVNEATGTDVTTIFVTDDITLTSGINVSGKKLNVVGNGNTISFDSSETQNGVFGNNTNAVTANTKISVSDLTIHNTSERAGGWASVIGYNAYSAEVSYTNCTFKNLGAAIYCNPVTKENSGSSAPSITITGCTFTKSGGIGMDYVNSVMIPEITFENNKGITQNLVTLENADGSEQVFTQIQAAIDNATDGATITVGPGNYDGNITFGGTSLTIQAQYPAYKDGVREDETSKLSQFTGTFNTYGENSSSFNDEQKVVIEGFALSGDGLKIGNQNYNSVGNLEVRHCTMTFGENSTSNNANPYAGWNYFVKTSGNNDEKYASVTVEDNYISGTPAENIFPIQLWDVDNAAVQNNVMNLSNAEDKQAINISKMDDAATVTITDNTIRGAGGGIYVTTWYLGGMTDSNNKTFIGSITVEDNTMDCAESEMHPIFLGWANEGSDGQLGGTIEVSGNTDNGSPVFAVIGQPATGSTLVTATFMDGNTVVDYQYGTNSVAVDFPTLSDRGYNHFVGWSDGTTTYDANTHVKIEKDTTFTAQWSYVPPANPNYKITIGAMENGTVTANPTAAKAGVTVTLTPVPDEGYALSTLTVTDRFGDAVRVTENSDGTYTFTMPNGQVTVNATFVETEAPVDEPFVDVAEGDWFYDAVVYAYQNELMDGVGGNRFAPNSETTRAQLVTILYRLEGEPTVSGDLPFTDVESGTWYTDAILWAAQNNIVNGVNDTEFAPGDEITRQQLVTILYRYAESKGYDVSNSADLSGYPDAGQVQDYAQPAMAWAVAENIIQGMEDGTLKPAGNASRAQIATILMRFCEDVAQ